MMQTGGGRSNIPRTRYTTTRALQRLLHLLDQFLGSSFVGLRRPLSTSRGAWAASAKQPPAYPQRDEQKHSPWIAPTASGYAGTWGCRVLAGECGGSWRERAGGIEQDRGGLVDEVGWAR